MNGPRFVVTELTGFLIDPQALARWGRPVTSYYVQDTHMLWRVVATFENRWAHGGYSYKRLRAKADRLCRRLNDETLIEGARG